MQTVDSLRFKDRISSYPMGKEHFHFQLYSVFTEQVVNVATVGIFKVNLDWHMRSGQHTSAQ